MNKRPYFIRAEWDEEADVWVASSEDVPGLATESATLEGLIEKLKVMIPELLEANGEDVEQETAFEVFTRRGDIMNMNTEKVRLNITLPLSIAKELYQYSEPRKRSLFVAEAIKLRILQLKQEKTKKLLTEGYKETKNESLEITKEFESIDIENWDEY